MGEMPAPDFDFLVSSLRLQVELSLGLLPFAGKEGVDFDAASHNIELLAMLQAKTKGNLTLEEQRAVDNSLTELRFRFVHAKEAHAQEVKQKEAKEKELKEKQARDKKAHPPQPSADPHL